MQKDKGYNNIITYCKAICIIIVVAEHTGINKEFIQFIKFFEVPLFFFTSGYCFKKKYLDDPKAFAIKRFYGLWKPFVLFTVCFILLHNSLYSLNLYDENIVQTYSLQDIIKHLLLAVFTMSNAEMLIGAIWFLRSLLIASLLAFFFIKVCRSHFKAIAMTYILTLISSFLFKYFSAFGWIEHFFFASTVFILGVIFSNKRIQTCSLPVAIGCVVLLCSGVYFSPTETRHFTTYNLLWLTFCTPAGILLTLKLANIIEQSNMCFVKKTMKVVGEHTLPILLLHFVTFKLVSAIIICHYDLSWEHMGDFPVITSDFTNIAWLIAYIFAGVCPPLLLAYYYNRIIAFAKIKCNFQK